MGPNFEDPDLGRQSTMGRSRSTSFCAAVARVGNFHVQPNRPLATLDYSPCGEFTARLRLLEPSAISPASTAELGTGQIAWPLVWKTLGGAAPTTPQGRGGRIRTKTVLCFSGPLLGCPASSTQCPFYRNVNWFFASGKSKLGSGGSGCEGIVCSYNLELGVFNGPANFPKRHDRKVESRIRRCSTGSSSSVPMPTPAHRREFPAPSGWSCTPKTCAKSSRWPHSATAERRGSLRTLRRS